MFPELAMTVAALRATIESRVRETDERIARLQVERDALLSLVRDPSALESIARSTIDQLRPADIRPALDAQSLERACIDIFQRHGTTMRWTRLLELLVQEGRAITPTALQNVLRGSAHFAESRQGWWRLRSSPRDFHVDVQVATREAQLT
ncbi:MAG: hypothetical protein IT453_20025 [Planctomycetes bacterium]|nr:hypothetical protein [Planctomycetota bacterium]